MLFARPGAPGIATRRWLLFAAALCLPPLLAAAKPLHLSDPTGMVRALEQGDQGAIQALVGSGKPGPILSELMTAAIRHDLAGVIAASRRCRDSTFGSKDFDTAIACGLRLAGSESLRGNGHGYVAAMHWLQKTGIPALEASAKGKLQVYRALETLDFGAALDTVQPLQKTLKPEAATVPLLPGAAMPELMLTINGREVRVGLDTGGNGGLAMSEALAQSLQLQRLIGPMDGLNPAFLSESAQQGPQESYWIAPTVELGPLRLSNYLVMTTRRAMQPEAIMGIELLAHFPAARVSRESLELLPAAPRCAKPTPLLFASNVQGNGELLFPAQINERRALVTFDTGHARRAVGTGALLPLVGEIDQSGGATMTSFGQSQGFRTGRATASVQVSGLTLPQETISVLMDVNQPAALYLGRALLEQARVTYDFDGAEACFEPVVKKDGDGADSPS